jgi:hypothetical protein
MSTESDAALTLIRSQDPAQLARAAQVLAASSSPGDQRTLLDHLKSPAFQERLDPSSEIDTGPDDRWIAKPLRSLANNPAPPARAALVELMTDEPFTSDPDHVDLLVAASIQFRPPAPAVVAFWRKHDRPDSVHVTRVVAALMENGDPLAVAEFERLLLATAPAPADQGGDARVRWLRGPFLAHRDNPAVLAMAQRLLDKPQPPNWTHDIQISMAEAVFLRRAEWYRPHQDVQAPPRLKTPLEGRRALRVIADQVRKDLDPSPILEAGIKATIAELDALPK